MKKYASILLVLPLALAIPVLPSCSTVDGTRTSVKVRDIENLSLIATAATFSKADTAERESLAIKLLAVTDGLDKLTGDTITAEQVYTIVTGYLGNSRPDYAILAAVLSDYIPALNTGGVAANLNAVSAGIKKAVAIYAPAPQ